MNTKKIETLEELYKRVKPALRTKRHELYMKDKKFISEKDIWNYNKENIWMEVKGLTLSQMVDDILNTDDKIYEQYVITKINKDDDKSE